MEDLNYMRMFLQVNGGHCSSDKEAKDACKQLAIKLGQDRAPAKSSFRVLAGQQSKLPSHSPYRCMIKRRHTCGIDHDYTAAICIH